MLGVTSKTLLRIEKSRGEAEAFAWWEMVVFEELKLNSFHVAEAMIPFSRGPDSNYFQLREPRKVSVT